MDRLEDNPGTHSGRCNMSPGRYEQRWNGGDDPDHRNAGLTFLRCVIEVSFRGHQRAANVRTNDTSRRLANGSRRTQQVINSAASLKATQKRKSKWVDWLKTAGQQRSGEASVGRRRVEAVDVRGTRAFESSSWSSTKVVCY